MLYRLGTEDKDRNRIIAIVSKYFDGFTVIPCIGVWQSARENALIVEIDSTDDNAEQSVGAIIDEVKALNHQDCIILQQVETQTVFV